MPDLSAYINFSVILNKPGGYINIVDNSNYPPGVAPTIKGNVIALTQPDGLTVGNTNFATPDIKWTGSGLNPAQYELRLNSIGSFQIGGYSVTYEVEAPGYSNTTLIKTFNLQYTRPTPVITCNFNNFTPVLTAQDSTMYNMSGFTTVSIAEAWAGIINSVNGTPQNISSTMNVFDLNYMGLYYDASYNITMNSIVTWALASPAQFVTIIDSFTLNQTFNSETPPSLITLLSYATFLKAQLDAAVCNCNTYPLLLQNYLLYMAVYTHLVDRGCNSDFAGLSSYVYQLQKIGNNNVTPPVSHTNLPIPAYDFGCQGTGTVDWNNITDKPSTVIIAWTVGQAGFPGNGAIQLIDARLAGYNVLILRNNIQEENYTKLLASDTITFANALSTGETLYVQSIPL